jgi:hypothetical protein
MTHATERLRAEKRVRQRVRRKGEGEAGAEQGPLHQTWRRQFLAKLAETSNVTRSCEHAGVNPSTVYDLRRRDPTFAQGWVDALCEGYDNLEMEMLHFLRTGESTEAAGHKFNPQVALRMLIAHRETVGRERARRVDVDVAEIHAAIELKVAQMRERVLARKAREEEQARDAADG